MVNIFDLPNEILMKIFSHIDGQSLSSCHHVSSNFKKILEDSYFKLLNVYTIFIKCLDGVTITINISKYDDIFDMILTVFVRLGRIRKNKTLNDSNNNIFSFFRYSYSNNFYTYKCTRNGVSYTCNRKPNKRKVYENFGNLTTLHEMGTLAKLPKLSVRECKIINDKLKLHNI